MKEILPTLRGLNAWTLKQKIKDRTFQRASTIQLLHSFDVYRFSNDKREELAHITGAENTKQFIGEHGVLNRKTGLMPSHSFVLQFMQHMECCMAHAMWAYNHAIDVKDTGNTARSIFSQTGGGSYEHVSAIMAVEAPGTLTTYGIVIGTNTTAPASTDYALGTLIAHGVGAGQLQYNSCGCGTATIAGANVDMSIIRTFTNGSGGSITAKEIGLVVGTCYTNIQGNFLIAHDSVNQAIAVGETAVVAYTLRTTV